MVVAASTCTIPADEAVAVRGSGVGEAVGAVTRRREDVVDGLAGGMSTAPRVSRRTALRFNGEPRGLALALFSGWNTRVSAGDADPRADLTVVIPDSRRGLPRLGRTGVGGFVPRVVVAAWGTPDSSSSSVCVPWSSTCIGKRMIHYRGILLSILSVFLLRIVPSLKLHAVQTERAMLVYTTSTYVSLISYQMTLDIDDFRHSQTRTLLILRCKMT